MNARADLASLLDFFEVPTGNAFDVAPEKAVGFFAAKGLKPSFSYAETLDGEHDKAFTIAKMMNVDMLGQVHASLESAIANGVPFKEWSKEIIPLLQAGGWWGKKEVKDPLTGDVVVAKLGSPARLETIFRTNAQSAYAAGHWQEIIDQQDAAPFLMYDAVDDFRTRPLHRSWDQKVLPVTNHWWSTHYPPNGWNCRCGVVQLSREEVDSLGLTPSIDPPKDGNYDWTNPRTGEVYTYPKGVDPGFANNPGQNYAYQLKQLLKEKEMALPDAMQLAAARADKKVQKLAADAVSGASQAQKSLASASAQAALERAQLLAAEKSKQYVAQQQIDLIAKGGPAAGKGASFKIKALQQLKADENWEDLKPSVQLAKVESLATLLKAKQALSSNLSLYKKAILDGKTPSPAAAKAFGSLSDADKAPFLEKIDKELAAFAAKKAAEAAKVAAGAEAKIIGGNPPDPATLTKVGEQRGSNPGGTYVDTATGQKWYIKQPASADVARNEVLAGKLYELAGVEVPELHIVTLDGKVSIASKIVEGLQKADAATLAAAPGTASGFAVDAWLANWDVIGLSFDNLLTLGSRAVRVDTGGALRYRAQGGLKGTVFGRKVTEIDSLRDPSLNRQAQQVFGRLTAAEIEDSVARVLSVPDEQIRAVVAKFGPEDAATRAELADLLIARKRDLEARFPGAAARIKAKPALTDAARVTEAEQLAVEASRVNGYSFATDSDQIEDTSVLVHAFKRNGGEATRGFFKLRPDASKGLLSEIGKSISTAGPPKVSLAEARNDMLAAIKSINYRAASNRALDVTVVGKINAAAASSKRTIDALQKAIAEAEDAAQIKAMQSQLAVLTEWRSLLIARMEDAAQGRLAVMLPGQFPTNTIPDSLSYSIKSKTAEVPAIAWRRVSEAYKFNTSTFDRSFATETSKTNGVAGTTLRYEADLPDGTRVTYFPHSSDVAYAMQGVVKIDVPGRSVQATSRVFDVIGEIGLQSTRATEIDRQHLYLNAFARIRLLRGAELPAKRLFDAVTDKGEAGVRAKLDILKKATGVDVEASEGWKTIDGVRQAFGHGRAYQFRPDLDTAEFRAFDKEYVIFHNPDGLTWDAGRGAFEKIKPVIEGGGVFASLTDRVRRGVPLSGSSVPSDLASGGGDYHFTRIGKRGGSNAIGSGIYWRARQIRRMDAITYESDLFGRTTGTTVDDSRHGQTVDSLKAASRGISNETIFKGGLSVFDDVDRIVLATESEVADAISWMQGRGYKTWPDGRQLSEVIMSKAKHNAKP